MANESNVATARIHSIRRLSNRELESKLDQLNTHKHALDAELILYLSELERRRLCREHACASLFEFCVTRLGYSEDTAYKRVGAARMLQQFPVVFELLANGRIHLTGLMLLKPHLTAANHQEWLSEPMTSEPVTPELATSERNLHLPCQNHSPNSSESQDPVPLRQAELCIERARQRTRNVPAVVRREVFARDRGQCAFVDRWGRRCEQRHFLEFDHCEAFAIGGDATVENIRLMSRAQCPRSRETIWSKKDGKCRRKSENKYEDMYKKGKCALRAPSRDRQLRPE